MKTSLSTLDRPELHQTDSTGEPSARLLLENLDGVLTETNTWLAQAQENERTMLAVWDGQSEDGRKWDKNYNRAVAPYDGCSDTRVRLADSAVDELAMLQVSAVFGANPQAVQMEAGDARTAGRVGTLLKYEIRQRMRAELWEETNFLATWMNACGHAVMWTRWQDTWVNGEETLTQEQLVGWLGEQMAAQMPEQEAAMQAAGILEQATETAALVLSSPETTAQAIQLIQQRYPVLSEKRAARVVKDLSRTGKAVFRLPVKRPGKPSVKALFPGIDIFYRWWCDKIDEAPTIYVIETLPEHKLRAKKVTEGWSQEFIDALLTMGPTPCVDMGTVTKIGKLHTIGRKHFDSVARGRLNARLSEMVGYYQVVRAFVKSVDEDGIESTHEVVCHPGAGTRKKKGKEEPLVGLIRLVDDFHEGGCFVSFRREYKTRKLWETRGVPELASSAQWQLKKNRDGRIDRADLATSPPVSVPLSMGKGERLGDVGVRPGKISYADPRGGRLEYMPPPRFDEGNIEVDNAITLENANLLGLENAALPPGKLMMHRQYLITGFLTQFREVVIRILALDQRYMDPVFVGRVVGGGELPFAVTREEIAGQFDVALEFDVRMLDTEYVKARWNLVREAMANDRSGVMRDPVFTKWVVTSIDPGLADQGFDEPQQAVEKDVAELNDLLAKGMQGFYNKPKDGANAQAMLAEIDKQLSTNPHMYSQYQQDAMFQKYVQALMQKYQFDLQQFDNAEKGRSGWTFDDAGDRAGVERGGMMS
jgi:hypothetical protein